MLGVSKPEVKNKNEFDKEITKKEIFIIYIKNKSYKFTPELGLN